MQKIKFLLTNISVEWSGILFYTDNNNIEALYNDDPEDEFIINLEDVLPLDIGSHSYTEYDGDHRIPNFLDKVIKETGKDELEVLLWKYGHIHSHHTMDTFFSGTDNSTLATTSPLYNYFLSLIVNNALKFNAFVAQKANIEENNNYEIKNGVNELVSLSNKSVSREVVLKHPCKINYPEEYLNVSTSFLESFRDMERKKEEEKKQKSTMTFTSYGAIYKTRQNKSSEQRTEEYKDQLSLIIGAENEDNYDIDPQLESFMIDCLIPDNIKREKVNDLANLLVFLDQRIVTHIEKRYYLSKLGSSIADLDLFLEYYDKDCKSLSSYIIIVKDFLDEILDFEGMLLIADNIVTFLKAYLSILEKYPEKTSLKRVLKEISILSIVNSIEIE